MEKNAKKTLWGVIAVLSCPCHAILWLPLLASTPLAIFTEQPLILLAGMAGVFILSLHKALQTPPADRPKTTGGTR